MSRFAQGTIRGLKFLLKERDLALRRVVFLLEIVILILEVLELCDFLLCSLKILSKVLVLVRQRDNLVFALQLLLFQRLDLGFHFLGPCIRSVCLGPNAGNFLLFEFGRLNKGIGQVGLTYLAKLIHNVRCEEREEEERREKNKMLRPKQKGHCFFIQSKYSCTWF